MRRTEIIDILDGTHPRVGRGVALCIYALIVTSAIVIAVETMPALPPAAHRALRIVEMAIIAVFAVEYALRLACAPRPLSYALSFWGIVDFIAVVPAILFLFPDLATIRAMRLVRLLRLMKLFKANRALDRIARAFQQVWAEFVIFLMIAIVILYLAAVGIYHFEHVAQPEAFASIPASLWWALATLTTVGYGDVYPVTTGGRMFTGLVLLVGFGVIAVPAGLITSALMQGGRGADTPRPPDGGTPENHPRDPNTEDRRQ
ncbi:ion transporter [Roseibacterium sp. SDUM158017]|uniref:ion transporter n=1 Tax=Roseicyclus salinarum TaxID=3036773 RepID=UPI002414E05E|nr:ion transporter [Roseibacterium sp. SDUM158017]MDG4647244.1 ion transporter [Roseibacterium sp. SDUM158017]